MAKRPEMKFRQRAAETLTLKNSEGEGVSFDWAIEP